MMTMTMMTNTSSIHHVTKLMNKNIKYTSFTSSSNFLSNNKSKSCCDPLLICCLKNPPPNVEINVDNVFKYCGDVDDVNEDEDDGFTVHFDISHHYMPVLVRTDRKSKKTLLPKDRIPEYRIPFKVITYGFGSKFKLRLGIESGMDITNTIAADLVAMNFNHIVSMGAKPTLFLTPHTCPTKLREAIKDIGLFNRSGFPISFSLTDEKMQSREITSSIGYGSVEDPSIDADDIQVGDVLIGLPSNGVHSHGFSLVTRVIKQSGSSLKDILPGTNITIGESLLMTPTTIYVKEVLDIIRKSKGGVNGIAYIDSGGLPEIKRRVLPCGLGAVIYRDSWPVPPIFRWIQEVGKIEDDEMRRTFNMGIGMILVINKENASRILEESCFKDVYCIGEVVSGDGVTYH